MPQGPSAGENEFTRLDELLDRALVQDLQRSEGPFALVGGRTSTRFCPLVLLPDYSLIAGFT